MTFNISVISHHGLWQLSDHRLSNQSGIENQDDAIKQLLIEAADGKAILTYAGVGKVADTPIAVWVRKLLRGENRTIEGHASLLLDACNTYLLPICRQNNMSHTFSLIAYVNKHPVIYIISNREQESGKLNTLFSKWHLFLGEDNNIAVSIAGSGAEFVHLDRFIAKALGTTIKRHADEGKLGPRIAQSLKRIHKKVAKRDPLVSAGCVVIYLPSPEDAYKSWFFDWDNTKPITLQSISGNMDVTGIMEALMPMAWYQLRDLQASQKGEVLTEAAPDVQKLLDQYDWSPRAKF